MRRLISIDLSAADIALFEEYEEIVLPLVVKYRGKVEMRVRALDGLSETHLLYFPDEQAFDDYCTDPIRTEARAIWGKSGARSAVSVVECL